MRNQLRQLELLLKVLDPPLFQHFLETDSQNMFCCFRWLLILFKREFYFDDIKTLWELIWVCPLTKNFHLFVAIAILNNARQELFQCQAFDEILKFINNQSQAINVPDMVQHAEIFYYLMRDRLVSHGPQELVVGIIASLSTMKIENRLSEISGIANSDTVLDQSTFPNKKSYLSDSEWLELLAILEIEANTSRPSSPGLVPSVPTLVQNPTRKSDI